MLPLEAKIAWLAVYGPAFGGAEKAPAFGYHDALLNDPERFALKPALTLVSCHT